MGPAGGASPPVVVPPPLPLPPPPALSSAHWLPAAITGPLPGTSPRSPIPMDVLGPVAVLDEELLGLFDDEEGDEEEGEETA